MHTRLLMAMGGCEPARYCGGADSNSVLATHTRRVAHVRSLMALPSWFSSGATDWYCVALHTLKRAHDRSEVAVGATDSY